MFGIRTGFSSEQTVMLNSMYEENRYPSNEKKTVISNMLGVPVARIHKWFDNRRQKERKTSKNL